MKSLMTCLAVATMAIVGPAKGSEQRDESAQELAEREGRMVEAARPENPMLDEIRQALDAQTARVGALLGELDRAEGSARALEIQREIEAAYRETEIAILRIQLDHAVRAGRDALVTTLEAMLTLAENPTVATTPVDRPAPEK